MTRVKRGYIAQKRRKKILAFVSGSRGAHSKLFRTANQHKMRASVSAYRDRIKRKRDLRRLWITRINAACRWNARFNEIEKTGISYKDFMHSLYKEQFLLNRKTFAQLAVLNTYWFYTLFDRITIYTHII
uniref:Large ribosomal subunit protein bL20c n=12 Tax=Taxaceae TaxID=25623 RepID=A0A140GA97_9CONI|nr:ribosomal protein L20 [Cephalotaxus harringtonia var. wilsoniana]YP_007890219.1 ribosomal protein L20 [Cephalotaxus oliveri]YP_009471728.1 ribosomal protein L20 [Cephalotaxus sinensis]YP_009641658.1 ribosomal protein L20 [Cephalotaxus hainanensis]YP_010137902.1 ribosomal protein L20 [Cephalotaxus fortunei var. alpina]YP_010137984.1 ribosomal protein L20 [Cephalotaxus fortunei]YP_010138066.1 ribosomal protein L20 [Cephalotaxus griffithii]YP_010138148.1 ribosomal protein L20 [Cephalotaxus h